MSEVCGNEWQARIVTSSGRDSGGQGWSPLQCLQIRLQIARKLPFSALKYILSR